MPELCSVNFGFMLLQNGFRANLEPVVCQPPFWLSGHAAGFGEIGAVNFAILHLSLDEMNGTPCTGHS